MSVSLSLKPCLTFLIYPGFRWSLTQQALDSGAGDGVRAFAQGATQPVIKITHMAGAIVRPSSIFGRLRGINECAKRTIPMEFDDVADGEVLESAADP